MYCRDFNVKGVAGEQERVIMAKIQKSTSIRLPQVNHVRIDIEIDFDKKIIRDCLKKRKDDYSKLSWPEAVKALYREFDKKENYLLHIRSCCSKALDEVIIPMKTQLWDILVRNNKEGREKILDL